MAVSKEYAAFDNSSNETTVRLRALAELVSEDQLGVKDQLTAWSLLRKAANEIEMWRIAASDPEGVNTQMMTMTSDAYSFGRYGAQNWLFAIQTLRMMGYTDIQIECILRSKYMRWIGDSALDESGNWPDGVQAAVREYMFKYTSPADVEELIDGTTVSGVYDDDGNFLTQIKKGG